MRKSNKEIKITKQIEVFVAEDGTEFATEKECLAYEKSKYEPTLNEMLRAALLTPSRKRNCEYQKEIEALGYAVYKNEGWKIVKVDEDGRWLQYIYKRYNDCVIRRAHGDSVIFGSVLKGGHCSRKGKYIPSSYAELPLEKLDLAGMLNAVHTYYPEEPQQSKAVQEMHQALKDRKYYGNRLILQYEEHQQNIKDIKAKYESRLQQETSRYEYECERNKKNYDMCLSKIAELLKKGDN